MAMCATCKSPLTKARECLKCLEYVCECGRLTGSLFISMCWFCQLATERNQPRPIVGGSRIVLFTGRSDYRDFRAIASRLGRLPVGWIAMELGDDFGTMIQEACLELGLECRTGDLEHWNPHLVVSFGQEAPKAGAVQEVIP